jgi:hypothetical protein
MLGIPCGDLFFRTFSSVKSILQDLGLNGTDEHAF